MSRWFSSLAILGLLTIASLSFGQAAQQYPIADKVADKIIAKYQTSTCEQLKEKKQAGHAGQEEEMQTRVVELLKNDKAMREHFLNRIAGPVVNKMFECGMIP
ncbi:MAG TPA: hypothetical protein VGP65_03000 [Candidatus Angelobacter sp.]|jgi:hypothetical protein|nr:hypothetical protein [Candidatus Angelobacter sp.]